MRSSVVIVLALGLLLWADVLAAEAQFGRVGGSVSRPGSTTGVSGIGGVSTGSSSSSSGDVSFLEVIGIVVAVVILLAVVLGAICLVFAVLGLMCQGVGVLWEALGESLSGRWLRAVIVLILTLLLAGQGYQAVQYWSNSSVHFWLWDRASAELAGHPHHKDGDDGDGELPSIEGSTVVNFDALDARPGDVTGPALEEYLAGYGIVIRASTPSTKLVVIDDRNSNSAVAPSRHNLLTQAGSNDPVSFHVQFAAPLASFQFTRAKLLAGPNGITHPYWTAEAFDADGRSLGSVREDLIASFADVPAATFTLSGPGIASVRFSSENRHFAAFSAVLLDDLVLRKN